MHRHSDLLEQVMHLLSFIDHTSMKEESKTMDVANIIQASQKLITDFFRWLVFRGRTIFDNDIVSSEDVLLLGKAKLLSIPNPHGSPDKKGFHLIEKWVFRRGLERWECIRLVYMFHSSIQWCHFTVLDYWVMGWVGVCHKSGAMVHG